MKFECENDTITVNGKEYPCTVSLVMGLIGGKWKAVILYHLKDEAKRYNVLRKEMPTVTERALSLQLKQLEEDGLVQRSAYGTKPPLKVTYALTPFGKTVLPLLNAITHWGNAVAQTKTTM